MLGRQVVSSSGGLSFINVRKALTHIRDVKTDRPALVRNLFNLLESQGVRVHDDAKNKIELSLIPALRDWIYVPSLDSSKSTKEEWLGILNDRT